VRVFPEKLKWNLVFSSVMASLSGNFLSFSAIAKTRMSTIKMLSPYR